MPSYVKKTTPINLVDGVNDHLYLMAKTQFPKFTGAKHSEAHKLHTKQLFEVIANNIDGDEGLIMGLSDSLGFHIYIDNIEHEDDYNRVSFEIVQYFEDQAQMEQAEAWTASKNIFGNTTGNGNISTRENVDFHKPYRS